MKKQLHDYDKFTAFERHQIGETERDDATFQDIDLQGYEINGWWNSVPAFYYMTTMGC